jgi:hypothetical protein
LAEGVEPLGAVALLDPTAGTEDESEPTAAFIDAATSSTAFFAAATSSAAIFAATASFAALFAAAASFASFLSTATDGSGGGAVAATETCWPMTDRLPVTDPPLTDALIRLSSGMLSSNYISSSLQTVRTTFPLLFLGGGAVSAPPWPPAATTLGIPTPRD